MRRRSAWAWLPVALFLCTPLSCFKSSTHHGSVKKRQPTDPLLQSKTPVSAHYGTTTDLHPRPDPLAPAVPAGAWVTTPEPGKPQLGAPEPSRPAPFRWTSDKRDLPAEGT